MSPVTRPGLAGGDDHDVRAADLGGEVAGPRVADRDRRVLADEQERGRHADDRRAADDDGVAARDLDAGPTEDLERGVGRRREEPVVAEAEQAGVERMDAVDVLGRVDGVDDRPQADRRRKRHLDDDPVDLRVGVELADRGRRRAASVASPSSSTKRPSMPTLAQPGGSARDRPSRARPPDDDDREAGRRGRGAVNAATSSRPRADLVANGRAFQPTSELGPSATVEPRRGRRSRGLAARRRPRGSAGEIGDSPSGAPTPSGHSPSNVRRR